MRVRRGATPDAASTLIRRLWGELKRSSGKVEPREVAKLYPSALASLEPLVEGFRAAFVAKSRGKSPVLFDAPVSEWESNFNRSVGRQGFGPLPRPHLQALSWHELPLAVACFCFPGLLATEDWLAVAWDAYDVGGYIEFEQAPMPKELPDWREQLAAIVARFPSALEELQGELNEMSALPVGVVVKAPKPRAAAKRERPQTLDEKACAAVEAFTDPDAPSYLPGWRVTDVARLLRTSHSALVGRQRDGTHRCPKFLRLRAKHERSPVTRRKRRV